MRVGMTYDLRQDYLAAGYGEEETAEFDRPDTIEAIAAALAELGHEPVRIGNVQALAKRLVAGERWDLVFNIAEGLYGFGREAQVPALLDAYRIPYTFADPLTAAVTLHKGMAKHVVRGAGVPTPDFAVVESRTDIPAVALPYPLFAKPVAEGTGKGVTPASKIDSPHALTVTCRELLERYRQPVLVETFLPGREFTVGITGTGAEAVVVGIMEVALRPQADTEVYSYRNKEYCEELVDYRLAEEALSAELGAVALKSYRVLGCRDGGRVDLRLDGAGRAHFLEVNPLAGMHPEHSDLPILAKLAGVSYLELVRRIVDSAALRVVTQRLAEVA
ncbi:MAG: D-alanine--D-alanine ligase [Gammaproteobacteria bacterium]